MLPSVDVLALVAVETLKVSLPTIVEATFGLVTREVCDRRLDSWSRHLVEQAGMQLTVTGRERAARGEAFVVMSNHQSHYDIPVLYQAFLAPLRMVAKKELFKIPIMSGAMRAAGFVEVDRGNRRNAIRQISTAREGLDAAVSIWIAPEGTRSRTGRLGTFKKGGFHLALQTGLRILPVTIEGTRAVLPSHGLHVTRGLPIQVTFGEPIDPNAYGHARMPDLMEAVRVAIERSLPAELRS